MRESGYYPPGAEFDMNAPYNQADPDEHKFDICISQTLSKSTSVNTNDYIIESNYLDADEGGGYVDEIITNETDWHKAYKEEHYTPLELINMLRDIYKKNFLDVLIRDQKQFKKDSDAYKKYQKDINKYKYLIKECSDWVEDETEIIEE